MPNKPTTDDHHLSAEEHAALHGTEVDDRDLSVLRQAIETAFDYRGDVTIVRKSTGEMIEGYLFDRRVGPDPGSSVLRLMPASGAGNVTIAYDDVARLKFTGRDTAAGKSFETWMRKYVRKKLAGQAASIESEPLDA